MIAAAQPHNVNGIETWAPAMQNPEHAYKLFLSQLCASSMVEDGLWACVLPSSREIFYLSLIHI